MIFKKNIIADSSFDEGKKDAVLTNLAREIHKKPLDAHPIFNEDGTITIAKSEKGRYLDLNEKFIFLLLILSSVIFETSFSASSLDKLDTSTSSTLTPLWIPVFKDSLGK